MATSPISTSNSIPNLPLPTQPEQPATPSLTRPRSKSLDSLNQLPFQPRSRSDSVDRNAMPKSTVKYSTQVNDRDKDTVRYATQATIKNDGLSDVDLPRVVQANRELHKTREEIPQSGNKLDDIINTQGESSVKKDVGSYFAASDKPNFYAEYIAADSKSASGEHTQADRATEIRNIARRENTNRAANAVVAGAGNCGEIAYVATRNLAGKFNKDESDTVSSVMSKTPGVDHAWSTLTSFDGLGKSPLIVDGHMDGPAVRAKDARNVHRGTTQELEKYSTSLEKREVVNDYEETVNRFKNTQGSGLYDPEISGLDDPTMTRAEQMNNMTNMDMNEGLGSSTLRGAVSNPEGFYGKTNVLSPQFREGARAAAIQLEESERLQGPLNIGELYVAPPGEAGSRESRVNSMIAQLSKDIGVFPSATAKNVAEVIRSDAKKSPIDEINRSWADSR